MPFLLWAGQDGNSGDGRKGWLPDGSLFPYDPSGDAIWAPENENEEEFETIRNRRIGSQRECHYTSAPLECVPGTKSN